MRRMASCSAAAKNSRCKIASRRCSSVRLCQSNSGLPSATVAIPLARATTFAVKFVPMAGQLIVLAEVATGRSIAGLGEKLSNADRALDAALLFAPHAARR